MIAHTFTTLDDALLQEVLGLVVSEFGILVLSDGLNEFEPDVIGRLERADSRGSNCVAVADGYRGDTRLSEVEILADDRDGVLTHAPRNGRPFFSVIPRNG